MRDVPAGEEITVDYLARPAGIVIGMIEGGWFGMVGFAIASAKCCIRSVPYCSHKDRKANSTLLPHFLYIFVIRHGGT